MKFIASILMALSLSLLMHVSLKSQTNFDAQSAALLQINNIYKRDSDSPDSRLAELKAIEATAIERKWQDVILQIKILQAQLLVDKRDYVDAQTTIDFINENYESVLDGNEKVRVDLVKLRLSDNVKSIDSIKAIQGELLSVIDGLDDKTLKSTVYQKIGESFFRSQEHCEAIKHLSQAYDISKQQNNTLGMIRQLNSLASVYTAQKDYEIAVRYYLLAYEQVQSTNNDYLRSIIEYNIGYNLYSDGKPQEAKSYYFKAIRSGEKANFEVIGMYSRQQLGVLMLDNGEWQEAIALNTEAYEFFKKMATI